MKMCEMLAVSGEKGWNTGMSPPFMLRLGKSVFAGELVAQFRWPIRQLVSSISFMSPFWDIQKQSFRCLFKIHLPAMPRTRQKSRQVAAMPYQS